MSVHSTLLGAGLQLVDGSDTESQDDQIQTSARRLQGRGIAAHRTTARSSFRPAIKSMAPKDRQPTITYSISMASFDVVDRFVLLQGFSRTPHDTFPYDDAPRQGFPTREAAVHHYFAKKLAKV
ncbi:hypothetical protein CTRI78_v005805 [Colletotrichum trifolii]|uniref:Uncharacterized protein n=1 Tax=Colletotrichum trifolii TaxID=5466 RepID=A0A4V3HW56_COLTR|nr:hypothetical protein CTRI78_v005805 [Colletotrichum trifolii]